MKDYGINKQGTYFYYLVLVKILTFIFISLSLYGQQYTPTETVNYEYWSNNSTAFSEIHILEGATASIEINSLNAVKLNADNFVSRISGYLVPELTGDYKFYLYADDQAGFYLSTDYSTENLRPVLPDVKCCAEVSTLTPIHLEAGRNYYFEFIGWQN